MSTLLTSCSSDMPDQKIHFIGDSIIARWDIRQAFPSRLVSNSGFSGSGIMWVESHAGSFGNEDVVVLSGTNDNSQLSSSHRLDYAKRFVDTALSLSKGRIFIFSILPRDYPGDREDINADIKAFNEILSELLADYPQLVFLDVYDSFKKGESINIKYYSDGLHLNDAGYEILNAKLRHAL